MKEKKFNPKVGEWVIGTIVNARLSTSKRFLPHTARKVLSINKDTMNVYYNDSNESNPNSGCSFEYLEYATKEQIRQHLDSLK